MKTKKDQGLPSSPSPLPGQGTLLLLRELLLPSSVQVVLTWMLGSRPGLANESTTSSYSSDWAHESSWPSKNRTFPGTTGKEVLFSQRYLLNCYNISREL